MQLQFAAEAKKLGFKFLDSNLRESLESLLELWIDLNSEKKISAVDYNTTSCYDQRLDKVITTYSVMISYWKDKSIKEAQPEVHTAERLV